MVRSGGILKSALDKHLLRPVNVAKHTAMFAGISSDFVDRIRKLRDGKGLVDRLDMEFFNWSIEGNLRF